jgi:plastocyanin
LNLRTTHVRFAAAAVAAAAAAACLASATSASSETTQPQKIYKATVVITNSGIALKPSSVTRGCIVVFNVKNSSTSTRDFFVGGYIARGLKPGASKKFNVQFLFRGKYPYYSTAHPGTRLKGSLEVT